jgi:CRISPR type III-A-associated protein Csm2
MSKDDSRPEPQVYKSLNALLPSTQSAPEGAGKEHNSASQAPPPSAFSPDYLKDGYFDTTNHIRREVFREWPESEVVPKLRGADVPATKGALRAFYSMLRIAKTQFDRQRRDASKASAALGDAKTQLCKMGVGAVYQCERGVISAVCKEFLFKNIDTVLAKQADLNDFARNLNAFVEHFQAVVAYLPEKEH